MSERRGLTVAKNPLPCADLAREALYIRSCIEIPNVGAHLVDDAARVEPSDFADTSHRAIAAKIYEFADSRARPYRSDIEMDLREPHKSVFASIMQGTELQPVAKVAVELKRLAKRRRAYDQCMRVVQALVTGDDERAVNFYKELNLDGHEPRPDEYMHASDTIVAARKVTRKSGDLRTGWHLLDRAIGQLRRGTALVVGGYEGTRKSTFMLGMCLNLAQRSIPCGYISCEDPPEIVGPRIAAHFADLNPRDFDGTRGDHFDEQVDAAIARAREVGLYFAFTERVRLENIQAQMKYLARKCGAQVIVVDYLQCFATRSDKRADYIGFVMGELIATAKELGIALVIGSQLSSPDIGKEYREPTSRQLKESGDIKDKARCIILLWKKNDEDNGVTLGKVSKCTWSPDRPRFVIETNPRTGAIVGLGYAERAA